MSLFEEWEKEQRQNAATNRPCHAKRQTQRR